MSDLEKSLKAIVEGLPGYDRHVERLKKKIIELESSNKPQPDPMRGEAPATWDLVVADMKERDRFGADKYGVQHQHDNGRDHLVDAYQELLDLTMYLRAEIAERGDLRARIAELEARNSRQAKSIDQLEARNKELRGALRQTCEKPRYDINDRFIDSFCTLCGSKGIKRPLDHAPDCIVVRDQAGCAREEGD